MAQVLSGLDTARSGIFCVCSVYSDSVAQDKSVSTIMPAPEQIKKQSSLVIPDEIKKQVPFWNLL